MTSAPRSQIITCVIPTGKAPELLYLLKFDKLITSTFVNRCRAASISKNLSFLDATILNVIVPLDRADEIFEYLYLAAEFDQPNSGIIYTAKLSGATAFLIPEEYPDEL